MQPNALPEMLSVDQRHLEPLVMRLYSGTNDSPTPAKNASLSLYSHASPDDRPYDLVKNVAVLPLRGYLGKREWWCDTSFDQFSELVRFAVKDSQVQTILIDCHSPGGSVYGAADCADVVFEANRSKRVVCCVNDLCASAALWVASAAREIVITQSGDVGSIGVYATRIDITENLKRQGISVELIRAGAQKAWGSSYLPMTDDERKSTQNQVDAIYDSFIQAVARNRRVNPDKVRSLWADAKVFNAHQALEVGLVDYVGSFDGVMAALGIRPAAITSSSQAQAALPAPQPARRLVQQWLETRTMPNGQQIRRVYTK